MSAKIVFDTKGEIPSHLQAGATEVDGKFELDASGVLSKNKELLGTNKTLTTQNQELGDEVTRLKASAIPEGKVPVTPEIEKLGIAAQSAGLKHTEIPALKNKVGELQAQIDGFSLEKDVDLVAVDEKLNARFKTMAVRQGLKFEKTTEKKGNEDIVTWFVVGEDKTKTKVKDFITTDPFFKEFADTFTNTDKKEGFRFGEQTGDTSKDVYTRIRENEKALEKQTDETANIDAAFGRAR